MAHDLQTELRALPAVGALTEAWRRSEGSWPEARLLTHLARKLVDRATEPGAQEYHLVDLSAGLDGPVQSWATDINNNGEIVGQADMLVWDGIYVRRYSHAFYWTETDGMVDLDPQG